MCVRLKGCQAKKILEQKENKMDLLQEPKEYAKLVVAYGWKAEEVEKQLYEDYPFKKPSIFVEEVVKEMKELNK